MADPSLKQKIERILKEGYFADPRDLVDVSDGDDPESIHVVIVSRKFDGKRMQAKHDLIWDQLADALAPEEWGQVTLLAGFSPQELKAVPL